MVGNEAEMKPTFNASCCYLRLLSVCTKSPSPDMRVNTGWRVMRVLV